MRYGKLITVVVLALAGLVVAAVTIRFINDKKEIEPDTGTELVGEASAETTAIEQEKFLLIAEENYLNLYSAETNGALKKSEKLNPSIFPDSDIAELKRGIVFDSEMEAYEMMENYID